MAEATSIAKSTIVMGLREVRAGLLSDTLVNVRRLGAGRRCAEVKQPGLTAAPDALVSPTARGLEIDGKTLCPILSGCGCSAWTLKATDISP